jgi:hypothetical protein
LPPFAKEDARFSVETRDWKLSMIMPHSHGGPECYSPGTGKWNKIEHQLFSFISLNWKTGITRCTAHLSAASLGVLQLYMLLLSAT